MATAGYRKRNVIELANAADAGDAPEGITKVIRAETELILALYRNLFNFVKNYKTKVLVTTGKKDTYSIDVREDTVKFNQTWDLISEKKKDYGRFTRQEYYPLLYELGIEVAREWEVLIGDGPNIICEGRATDISNLITNLQTKKFRKAKRKLKEYIERYESRILIFHIRKVKGYKSASYEIISG